MGDSAWRSKGSLIVAWIATCLAILAAVWPGMESFAEGTRAEYDPTVALTAVTAIGLVWYTYITSQTLFHGRLTWEAAQARAADDARDRRESSATAVLAELLHLTARLRNLGEHQGAVIPSSWIATRRPPGGESRPAD
jgi:hypothetical protein